MQPSGQVISFGPYRLDPASGRLLRGGTNVPLRLKTFAVLEYLAARPGRLVGKDELLDAVWPDTQVTPSVLTGCVRELRRALGDDAKAARFVETAYRRGYRFVAAPVVLSATAEPESPPGPDSALVAARDAEIADLARRFVQAVGEILTGARGARSPDSRRRSLARRSPRRRTQRVSRDSS